MKKLALKIAFGIAAIGYLVAMGIYLAPAKWHLSDTLVIALCPPVLLTITVDPSFTSVAILLAPLNALLYGLVGILIGLAVEEVASERTK